MDEDYIKKNLNTELIGKNIIYYNSIDSTHLFAKSLKENEIDDGTLILANNQTSGVGTHERKWYTGYGKNLSFNIILLPNCNILKFNKLTIIIAECIKKILKNRYDIDTTIKEPNDIMLNNKKIAGILTESIVRGNILKIIYIGIGINVNQDIFPGNLDEIATSLKRECNIDYKREEILIAILKEFENEYKKMLKE